MHIPTDNLFQILGVFVFKVEYLSQYQLDKKIVIKYDLILIVLHTCPK